MNKPARLSRRTLVRSAGLAAARPAAQFAEEPQPDELARAREAIRAQGRRLAEAGAKLPAATEPAFRFEA